MFFPYPCPYSRGESGYGFLLSGECPTVIGSVAKSCPAQEAGLRSGDVVLKVNDSYVANSSHDEIVTLVGSCLDPLRLTISDPDQDSGQNARHRQKRYRRSLPEGQRRSVTSLSSGCEKRKSFRRRKVAFENHEIDGVLPSSSDDDDNNNNNGEKGLVSVNRDQEWKNKSVRRRKSEEKLSSHQSKRQSNSRNHNLSFVDKQPVSKVESRSTSPRCSEYNMHSALGRQSNCITKSLSEGHPIMDKNARENKENVILRVNQHSEQFISENNNDHHIVLPTQSTNQVKLAKKASLTSLSSLTEELQQQQRSSTSRPPSSQSLNPPPVPPHRNLSSLSNPSDRTEFQHPPPPPRPAARRSPTHSRVWRVYGRCTFPQYCDYTRSPFIRL